MRLEAEFTSEPFHGEGSPPEHALAARDAAVEAGLETDFGPLGTLARGEAKALLDAIPAIAKAALEGGATQVTLQVRLAGTDPAGAAEPAAADRTDASEPAAAGRADASEPAAADRTDAAEPAAAGRADASEPAAAGKPEPADARTPGAAAGAGAHDTRTAGSPETVVELTDALARLIADLEREMGAKLGELDRAGKQRAVRILRERGAFGLRKSVSSVADALGVTRFTVYNYLNREAD